MSDNHWFCDECKTERECGRNMRCKLMECPICNGLGTVNPLTAPDDFFCAGTVDCPACDGSGEVR
jgi:DnaJ-class molecular chaperone